MRFDGVQVEGIESAVQRLLCVVQTAGNPLRTFYLVEASGFYEVKATTFYEVKAENEIIN